MEIKWREDGTAHVCLTCWVGYEIVEEDEEKERAWEWNRECEAVGCTSEAWFEIKKPEGGKQE